MNFLYVPLGPREFASGGDNLFASIFKEVDIIFLSQSPFSQLCNIFLTDFQDGRQVLSLSLFPLSQKSIML